MSLGSSTGIAIANFFVFCMRPAVTMSQKTTVKKTKAGPVIVTANPTHIRKPQKPIIVGPGTEIPYPHRNRIAYTWRDERMGVREHQDQVTGARIRLVPWF